jgi:hypothetical protein
VGEPVKDRGGRPPLVPGERAVPVSSALARIDHGAVCSLASQSQMTLSEYTRAVLKMAIRQGLILKTTP